MHILVFDSGLGGLTVAEALRELAPRAGLAYAADNAGFPYGARDETALVERMCKVIGGLIDKTAPDVVVIACNTASTIGLEALRRRFDVPFVGTVPAIKPAANLTRTGHISVLATPGTVEREYTRALMETYAFHCRVKLHGAQNLARMAEDKLAGRGVDMDALRAEIAPAFVEEAGGRTDVVVLGCTHYPLLLTELKVAAAWPVVFIDPSLAIARQALKVAQKAKEHKEHDEGEPWAFADHVFLTGKTSDAASVYAQFGFVHCEQTASM